MKSTCFSGNFPCQITDRVNAWIKENQKDIIILSIKMSESVAMPYHELEVFYRLGNRKRRK